jgi:hypothetical protein
MADWRSAYHRCIAARPPDSSTGNAVNGEGAAGALSVVSVPSEAWSAVPAFRGLCAATARDCTAALATGGFSTRTIFKNCRTGQAESDDGREQQGRAGEQNTRFATRWPNLVTWGGRLEAEAQLSDPDADRMLMGWRIVVAVRRR